MGDIARLPEVCAYHASYRKQTPRWGSRAGDGACHLEGGITIAVPRIAEFAGILIYMYFADHNPPHFHAVYGGESAQLAIADQAITAGELPKAQTKRVQEWASQHTTELMDNWHRCQRGEAPLPIDA